MSSIASSPPIILSTGPIEPAAVELLRPFGEVVIAASNAEADLARQIQGACGLIVRGTVEISRRVLEQGRDLKVIGRTGAGYDNIDVAAANELAIPIVYTPGAGARGVAEAAFAYMLLLCKDPLYWDAQVKNGNWKSRTQSVPGDLDEATLGIVGFGKIGGLVADIARAFNMTILAHDPYADPEAAASRGVRLVDLPTLLAASDFVSLHAPVTPQTRGLINASNISQFKTGAFLINLGRGELIENLDILLGALESGRLAGVALDVFDPEPPRLEHPIFRHPRLYASPHILGVTRNALHRICDSMSRDMVAVFEGRQPNFLVNPHVYQARAAALTTPGATN